MNKKQEIIRGHLTCTCDEAYKSRKMVDPNCFLCEYESEIELMMDEYAESQLKILNMPIVGCAKRKYCEECKTWLPLDVKSYHYCPECGAIVPF